MKLLDDTLFESVYKYLSSKNTMMIKDHAVMFYEAQISSKDYDSIMKEAKDICYFKLLFTTPTYLSKSGSRFFSLFPEPRRIFMNLLRIWNAFSPLKISREEYEKYWEWLDENVGISAYNLNTIPIKERGVKAKVGFVGSVAYRLSDKTYSRITDALLRFSEFSNIGGGRTSGMGVVKVSRFIQPPTPQEAEGCGE